MLAPKIVFRYHFSVLKAIPTIFTPLVLFHLHYSKNKNYLSDKLNQQDLLILYAEVTAILEFEFAQKNIYSRC